MAGAIFVISRQFPEHWQAALEAGFWESKRFVDLHPGDLLVFWQSGAGLLGVCLATGSTEPVDYHLQGRPWSPDDHETYQFRYRLVLLADRTMPALRWKGLTDIIGSRAGANTAPVTMSDPGALSLLRELGLDTAAQSEATKTSSPGETLLRDVLGRSRPHLSSTAPYAPADEAISTPEGVVFERDPQAVDRGLRAHAQTQNAAAGWLLSHGVEPASPIGAVNFDLSWSVGGTTYVGEVKSLHELNERSQLRLGIGQVLEFAFRLEAKPVLILERQPSADYWQEICDAHGIVLVWPDTFDRLIPATH